MINTTQHTPFFYVIEHQPTGKLYMGSKWSSNPNSFANPSLFMVEGGYHTSSKVVKQLIKSDGLSSFSIKEIVLESDILDKFESIFKYEIHRLKEVDAGNNPAYLNKTDGVLISDSVSDRDYWLLRKYDNEIHFTAEEKSIYWQFQECDLNRIIRDKEEANKAKELVSKINRFLRTRSLTKINPEEVGLPRSYTKWKPVHLEQVLYDLENRFLVLIKIYRKRFQKSKS